MSAQPEHGPLSAGVPSMRTLAELRAALRRYGLPGDLPRFDAELAAADLDDLTHVREITQAYRHRVLLNRDQAAATAIARSTGETDAELRRKMSETSR
ncbi:hypothetical protein [Streptomyces sp. NRRL F-5630]|uniref:hypothetical protein n=1 Tax=Streptomyces sp. NRRL F-5630 TaxID=1463864 RepID=UPI0004C72C34|nr:hypothetical protein [Streptomyces sp. NRRL F-5630]